MKYFLHTTTMQQRLALLQKPFIVQEISIDDFLGSTLAIDEDLNELYKVDYSVMLETLEQFDKHPDILSTETKYFEHWRQKKGPDYCDVRVRGFKELYDSIREEGLREPVSVEITGQKIDGSHRAAVMKHLGHKTIPARVFTLTRFDIDKAFLERTAQARYSLFGENYYYIQYDGFQNIQRQDVYKENSYERWEVLKDIIEPRGKAINDLGCNEGFMSIMCALYGAQVNGYDHEFVEGANFNKLAFDFEHGTDLPINFIEAEMFDVEFPTADVTLLLNAIYHVPREKQSQVMQAVRKSSRRLVMQGNLRKAHEVDRFNGCTVETMVNLCADNGFKIDKVIEWRDKPILIAV